MTTWRHVILWWIALAVGASIGWRAHDLATERRVVCGWYDMRHVTPNVPELHGGINDHR